MSNLREKLEAFLYDLDLQIDDIEKIGAGKQIQVFFDTAHLVSAVLGLHDFYNQLGRFKRGKFDNPTALVTSLAASNWLGEIRLLPPHQAEFLRRWKLDFGVDSSKRPEILAKKFLRDVGYTDSNWTMRKSLNELSDDQIRRMIMNQVASAPTFFKAVQNIVPWHRRMAKMLEEEALNFQSTTENYERIIKSRWPEELTEVFNQKRRDMTINNVTDALAIAILVEKVRGFNAKETKILPFMFPSDLLLEAVGDNKLAQELTYGHTPEGRAITAVKDWKYFVVKASFSSTPNGRHTRGITKETEGQLRTLRKEIATMLTVDDEISIDSVAQTKAFGKPLSQLIEEIDQLAFLENVWLKAEAPTDLKSAIHEVSEAREDFRRNKRVQSQASRILAEKLQVLSSNVGEIEWIMRLWADLENQGKRLHEENFSKDFQTRDFFRDRGLLRYSFPQKSRSKIEHVLRELVGTAFREARKLVVNACLKGIKDPTGERDGLVTGAAVLLTLDMNEPLIELLERVDPNLPHFSLKIVYVEQIFLQRENRQRGERLLEELGQEYKSAPRKGKKADLAIGLAYLMFRLWVVKGGKVKWRPLDVAETAGEPPPSVQKFVDDAIYYANQAYIGLRKSRDLKKKAYALNQYLYYLVEGGGNDRIKDMIEAAQILSGFAGQSQVWQYRFDDTLARFFHRMATTKTNAQDWNQAMESAHDHIESACKRAYGDRTPLGYLSKIDTAIQAGFGASVKPKRPPRLIRVSNTKGVRSKAS